MRSLRNKWKKQELYLRENLLLYVQTPGATHPRNLFFSVREDAFDEPITDIFYASRTANSANLIAGKPDQKTASRSEKHRAFFIPVLNFFERNDEVSAAKTIRAELFVHLKDGTVLTFQLDFRASGAVPLMSMSVTQSLDPLGSSLVLRTETVQNPSSRPLKIRVTAHGIDLQLGQLLAYDHHGEGEGGRPGYPAAWRYRSFAGLDRLQLRVQYFLGPSAMSGPEVLPLTPGQTRQIRLNPGETVHLSYIFGSSVAGCQIPASRARNFSWFEWSNAGGPLHVVTKSEDVAETWAVVGREVRGSFSHRVEAVADDAAMDLVGSAEGSSTNLDSKTGESVSPQHELYSCQGVLE